MPSCTSRRRRLRGLAARRGTGPLETSQGHLGVLHAHLFHGQMAKDGGQGGTRGAQQTFVHGQGCHQEVPGRLPLPRHGQKGPEVLHELGQERMAGTETPLADGEGLAGDGSRPRRSAAGPGGPGRGGTEPPPSEDGTGRRWPPCPPRPPTPPPRPRRPFPAEDGGRPRRDGVRPAEDGASEGREAGGPGPRREGSPPRRARPGRERDGPGRFPSRRAGDGPGAGASPAGPRPRAEAPSASARRPPGQEDHPFHHERLRTQGMAWAHTIGERPGTTSRLESLPVAPPAEEKGRPCGLEPSQARLRGAARLPAGPRWPVPPEPAPRRTFPATPAPVRGPREEPPGEDGSVRGPLPAWPGTVAPRRRPRRRRPGAAWHRRGCRGRRHDDRPLPSTGPVRRRGPRRRGALPGATARPRDRPSRGCSGEPPRWPWRAQAHEEGPSGRSPLPGPPPHTDRCA